MAEKRRDSKGRVLRSGESQRPDGKYMFRYTDHKGVRQTIYSWQLVGTDKIPDGKRCKAALRDMEKVVLRDLDDGIHTADANQTTLDQLFSSYLDLRDDLRATTKHGYVTLYNKHVKERFGHIAIIKIKHSDIVKLYNDLAEHLKASSIRSIHVFLYQAFEIAVKDNALRYNPAADAFKTFGRKHSTEQTKRHALTEEEQERLVNYVYQSKRYRRWAPLFTVLLGTGMRIGEALGLRWCDCNFEENVIDVNHELLYKPVGNEGYAYRISEPKTKAGIRTIPMFNDVRNALLELQKQYSPGDIKFEVDGYTDFIFLNKSGKVFTPASFFDTIRNVVYDHNKDEALLAKEEGREPCYLPNFSAHILRHTFCTRMCELEPNAKNVQDVMGHRRISTTMDVYNEATATKKQASFKNLEGKMKLA